MVRKGEVPTPEEGRQIVRDVRAMQTAFLERDLTAADRQRMAGEAFDAGGNYAMLALAATCAWRFGRAAKASAHLFTIPVVPFPRSELMRELAGGPPDVVRLGERCLDLVEMLIPGQVPESAYRLLDGELMQTAHGGLDAFMRLAYFAVECADMAVSFVPELDTRQDLLQAEALEAENYYGGIL